MVHGLTLFSSEAAGCGPRDEGTYVTQIEACGQFLIICIIMMVQELHVHVAAACTCKGVVRSDQEFKFHRVVSEKRGGLGMLTLLVMYMHVERYEYQ